MRPRRLPPALLATLAALVLVTGPFAPAQADAADEAIEGETITTVLHPGWNAAGWVGPETPTSELFEQIEALRVVAMRDAGEYRYAWPDRTEGFPALTPGIGLWLYLSGDTPVHWARPAAPDGLVLRLRAGLNLVGVLTDGSVTPPDDSEARAWRWDPSRQEYEPYRFGDATLSGGEALWIEAAAPFNLWQPGTAGPPIVFLDDIPDHIQAEIRAAYERAQGFFAERFGVAETSRIPHIGSDVDLVRDAYRDEYGYGTYAPGDRFCAEGSGRVRFWTLDCAYPPDRLAYWSAPRVKCCGSSNTLWMSRGTDAYVGMLYRAASRSTAYETARGNHIASVRRAIRPQRSLDTWHHSLLPSANRSFRSQWALRETHESLSFLAVEWLATRAGNYAITEYYQMLARGLSLEDAFLAAFGISVPHFSEVFEAHAEAVAPPLPHLLDLRREPVLVFLGDIPANDKSVTMAEFRRVQQFFAERFKARPEEFTVYVAPDAETMRATLPEWDEAPRSCSRPYRSVVAITLDRCGTPPAQHTYVIEALMTERGESGLPRWLTSGARAYASTTYRAAEKGLNLEQYRNEVMRRAATAPPLRELQYATDEALGYLAVEWLVNRAGEDSLFGFYFTRSRVSLDLDRLFALSFGLTIEDFYEQFEAYRATLQ